MRHLGERVSAQEDGELSHSERERALAHLTFCADCRAEVEAVRALKNRLRSLEGPSVPADLTMSLLRMSEPGGPLPPRVNPFPDASRVFGGMPVPSMHGFAPPDNRPRGHARPRGGRARRAGYVAVGLTSAAMAFGTMFVIGGMEPAPSVVPQMERFANQHRTTIPYGPATAHATPIPTPTPTVTPTAPVVRGR